MRSVLDTGRHSAAVEVVGYGSRSPSLRSAVKTVIGSIVSKVGHRSVDASQSANNASDFDRFLLIRFPLIMAVVLFHADRGGAFSARLAAYPQFAQIIHIMNASLTGIRVPIFFVIAGYILFRDANAAPAWFVRKIGSRVRSVLVPLICWNVLALVALAMAQHFAFTASMLHSTSLWSHPVTQFSFTEFSNAIIGSGRAQPLIYPLWFLHDLFVLVLLSPLIYFAAAKSPVGVLVTLAVITATGFEPMIISRSAFCFFVLGSVVAITRRSLFALDPIGPFMGLVWLLIQVPSIRELAGQHANQIGAIAGLVGALALSGWLISQPWAARALFRVSRYSFFVFAAHEPLLTFVRTCWFKLFVPQEPAAMIAAYFLIPLMVVMVLIGVFELAERLCPRVLAVMTGGRAGEGLVSYHAPGVRFPIPAPALGVGSVHPANDDEQDLVSRPYENIARRRPGSMHSAARSRVRSIGIALRHPRAKTEHVTVTDAGSPASPVREGERSVAMGTDGPDQGQTASGRDARVGLFRPIDAYP